MNFFSLLCVFYYLFIIFIIIIFIYRFTSNLIFMSIFIK